VKNRKQNDVIELGVHCIRIETMVRIVCMVDSQICRCFRGKGR